MARRSGFARCTLIRSALDAVRFATFLQVQCVVVKVSIVFVVGKKIVSGRARRRQRKRGSNRRKNLALRNKDIRLIDALEQTTPTTGKPAGRKPRRHMSADARRRIGLAMKKRWAERKGKKLKRRSQ